MKKICLSLCNILVFFGLYSQNGDVGHSSSLSAPIFLYESECILKNDTIFYLQIYPSKEIPDSVVNLGFATKQTKSKWITNKNSDGCYSILKYKIKKKKCKKDNSIKYECIPKGTSKCFCPDGTIRITYRLGSFNYTKIKSKTHK